MRRSTSLFILGLALFPLGVALVAHLIAVA